LIFIAGGILLVLGVAMLFLPGPAVLILSLALIVLSSEFPWARRLLDRLRGFASELRARLRARVRHTG